MTKEQIEQKADMYIKDFHDTELSETDLILFAEQLISEATKEFEAQTEKMSEILLDLLWFEEHLDPYTYECNDAQKGELLKPFDNARLFLEKYKCKKCKGEGTIKVGYNGWTTNPCPTCEGKGVYFKEIKENAN